VQSSMCPVPVSQPPGIRGSRTTTRMLRATRLSHDTLTELTVQISGSPHGCFGRRSRTVPRDLSRHTEKEKWEWSGRKRGVGHPWGSPHLVVGSVVLFRAHSPSHPLVPSSCHLPIVRGQMCLPAATSPLASLRLNMVARRCALTIEDFGAIGRACVSC